MREMTIGQFYSTDSIIHRLDPRVKIAVTLLYVISLFFVRNIYTYGIALLFMIIYIKLSRVPLRYIAKGTRGLFGLIIITVLIQLFTVKGVENIVDLGFISITKTALFSAVNLFVRLILIIIGSSMMTYTTTPTSLTDGLEKMLSWMKKIKVPVHEFAMMMSIALRFIPVLVDEADRIVKAQTARGMDFKEGSVIVRVKKLFPIIIPLFVSAIRRSNELALAMDARCYHGGEGRTKMKALKYERNDYIAYILLALYLVLLIVVKNVLHLGFLDIK